MKESKLIEMQNRLEELTDKWARFGLQEPFKMRIGINTGFCTVGNFGSENRLDYTVIGAGVNMAARLESAAASGSILLSFDTYNLVKDKISCRESERIKLKGISNPVRTYEVVEAEDRGSVITIKTKNSFMQEQLSGLTKHQIDELSESLTNALDTLRAHAEKST